MQVLENGNLLFFDNHRYLVPELSRCIEVNIDEINSDMDNNLAINFFNYFADITYGSAAYAYTLDNRGNTLHFGVSYINYGDFEGYNEIGEPTNNFTGNETAISVGYANKFNGLPIYYGINIKLITSKMKIISM